MYVERASFVKGRQTSHTQFATFETKLKSYPVALFSVLSYTELYKDVQLECKVTRELPLVLAVTLAPCLHN